MKRINMKRLKRCFGTKEHNEKSAICKQCQFIKKCEKERRTFYEPIKITHPKYKKTLQL